MSMKVSFISFQDVVGQLDDYKVEGVGLGNLETEPSEKLESGALSEASISSEILSNVFDDGVKIKFGYKFNDVKFIVQLIKHTQVVHIGKGMTWKYYDPNTEKWSDQDEDAKPITLNCGSFKCTMTPTLGHDDGSINVEITSSD
ncbi:hypothetical protein CW749_02195 [Vibrio sp. vnigr-6D03]|uniref:hypothetical protein n=1 Tax=Vibrio sp. vnigr-6D03 TaxID=2058088 RepID=UPI000C33791F|nr:hypothetical protein [Vibrio sp. vnigr-6D03]PKF81472.1 hypothetical protein CW749_02195 [Vibrio sp. vnigr-6D03]